MRLFWLKRLREQRDGSSWALPFGDLMSLLLAVFVMIAAMSRLEAGPRFDSAGSAVRQAFGFEVAHTGAVTNQNSDRWSALLARLSERGVHDAESLRRLEADRELFSACELELRRDSLLVRVNGDWLFDAHGAQVRERGLPVIERLAGLLAEGRARIEVRGHAGSGPTPAGALYRDALDLSYGRARAVSALLVARGVSQERLLVTAAGWTRPQPNVETAETQGRNRTVEIIVHAAAPADDKLMTLEKGQATDG